MLSNHEFVLNYHFHNFIACDRVHRAHIGKYEVDPDRETAGAVF